VKINLRLIISIAFIGFGSGLFAQRQKKTKTIEIIYDFAETSDSDFCNSNSIITMDCAGGSLYFTNAGNIYFKKNGTVVCTFLNEDSTIYFIGKYKMSDDGTACVFDRTYSFENNYYNDEKKIPAGMLNKIQPWDIKLLKLTCERFDYSFILNEKNKYVLYKCSHNDSELFINNLKKNKVPIEF
jgi:hypothetical protein